MKKAFFYMIIISPLISCAKTIQINDGLYYGYWVYKDKGVLKEYGVLANNPRKNTGEYILNPVEKFTAADEIYIKIKNNTPTLYFYHDNSDAELNVAGWAGGKFLGDDMIVSANTIRFLKEDSKERIAVGEKFNGKVVQLKIEEKAPIKTITNEGFDIDCNQYLKTNDYAETGLPDYEEPDPKGREGIGLSYPATVFSVGELGICAAFLNEDIVPQIKNGWIQFRRLN